MRTWAESKQIPGQFTGSTGARILTPAELTSGYQAWARRVSVVFQSVTSHITFPNSVKTNFQLTFFLLLQKLLYYLVSPRKPTN